MNGPRTPAAGIAAAALLVWAAGACRSGDGRPALGGHGVHDCPSCLAGEFPDPPPAPLGTVTTLARFDPAAGEFPFPLEVIPGNGTDWGTPLVGFVPTGRVVRVTTAPNGGSPAYSTYASFDTWTPGARLIGLRFDAEGTLYVAVGHAPNLAGPDAGPIAPAAGIYKVPRGGGAPVAWSRPATPPIEWPAGMLFLGRTLYVADPDGYIRTIDTAGTVQVWRKHARLKGSSTACGLPLRIPRPLGAEALMTDGKNIYVTNLATGALYRVPITGVGAAGNPVPLVKSCAFQGAKFAVLDRDGSILWSVEHTNVIYRILPSGQLTIFAKFAPPFDQVSQMYIETAGGRRRLLVTNFAYASFLNGGASAAAPSLIAVELAR